MVPAKTGRFDRKVHDGHERFNVRVKLKPDGKPGTLRTVERQTETRRTPWREKHGEYPQDGSTPKTKTAASFRCFKVRTVFPAKTDTCQPGAARKPPT